MDHKKQKLIIEYLLSSTDTFALCESIVDSEYFDPEFRETVSFIKDYFDEYHTTPDDKQVEAETGVQVDLYEIKPDQVQYCMDQVEKFCKRRAIERAVLASPKLINDGDYDSVETKIREALLVSLQRDLGLRYFEDPEKRHKRMMEDDPVTSTGWLEMDEALFGGIARKELLLVSASSGGGKSITLANLGFNFLYQGLNVLYVSLELSEDVVAQRFDTMFSGIGRKVWKEHSSEICTRLASAKEGCGVLDIIHRKSGTRANEIRAYLKEYYLHYNMMPDLLIIDYVDKMNPNEKNIDLGDVWTKDKLCSEQIRDIGVDFNMFVATASQLNRSAVGATHHDHGQIAGGISKINEADVYWSIVMTAAMRAKGEICFFLQKTRNSDGEGRTIYLDWKGSHLRIVNPNDVSGLRFKKRDSGSQKDNSLLEMPDSGGGLLDLMSSTN